MLIPGDTQVQAHIPDDGPLDLLQFTVRVTEFTSGGLGKSAMPGDLPSQTAFTYAIECDVDEAEAVGASHVTFSNPVIQYVENFTDTPVGEFVPLGYFDRERDVWVPELDGRVIKAIAIDNGAVVFSLAADDTPASATELAALGITTEELGTLSTLLTVGATYWRVRVPHFSPWDCNYPYGVEDPPPPTPPGDADGNGGDEQDNDKDEQEEDEDDEDPCKSNSHVAPLTQVLGESLPVTGTPYHLIYRSNRVPGRKDGQTLDLRITTAAPVRPTFQGASATVVIAGRSFSQDFPAVPDQSWQVQWDGLDAYGRPVVGSVNAIAKVHHRYPQVYYGSREAVARSFAQLSDDTRVIGQRGGTTLDIVSTKIIPLRRLDARLTGIAGWHVNVHHVYDPVSGELHRGNGARRRVQVLKNGRDRIIHEAATFAGTLPLNGGVCTDGDGNLYVAERYDHRVTRIATDGTATVIAGTGSPGPGGDGGPATAAQLYYPSDVAVSRDGSIYVLDDQQRRIRRVRPDGVIEHIAGGGNLDPQGGNPAADVNLTGELISGIDLDVGGSIFLIGRQHLYKIGTDNRIVIIAGSKSGGVSALTLSGRIRALDVYFPPGFIFSEGFAVDADGTVYFSHNATKAVYKLDKEGFISLLAGVPRGFGLAPNDPPADGSYALDAKFGLPIDMAIDTDGSILIADQGFDRIFRILPNGLLQTAVGGGTNGSDPEGASARDVKLGNASGVAVRPNRDIAVLDSGRKRLYIAQPRQPKLGEPAFTIPSGDGDRLFHFGPYGRHLTTTDSVTGVRVHAFDYDTQGRLIAIRDADDRATTITRDADGTPTAITSPDGQTTQLGLDADGWLNHVTEPGGAEWGITCTADGLLTALTTPNGDRSAITYDALGRLLTDTNPAGGTVTLTRSKDATGVTITASDGEGRTDTYLREFNPDATRQRSEGNADGSQASTWFEADGTQVRTDTDGTVTRRTYAPDPRFGERSNYLAETRTTLPSGLVRIVTVMESATLTDPDDPLSVESYRTDRTRNSVTASTVYDAATRTHTQTSPAGRESVSEIDANGHVIRSSRPGRVSDYFSYDTQGRLLERRQGEANDPDARVTTFSYDAQGQLTALTDAENQSHQFTYDANGNLHTLAPPGRPAHRFEYTPIDLEAAYIPPALDAGDDDGQGGSLSTRSENHYNLAKELTNVLRADGKPQGYTYNTEGQLSTLSTDRGDITYSYDTSGRASQIDGPDGSLAYGYDGFLLTAQTWTRSQNDHGVAGSVDYQYDADFNLAQVSVNQADPISHVYDADDLLTQVGELTLSRNSQTGDLTATSLGRIATQYGYNAFGELSQSIATDDGNDLYQADYERDQLGRITRKTETLEGVTQVSDYRYDLAGRLDQVTEDGQVTASYVYDANGNRLEVQTPTGTQTATYDSQDRLLTHDGTSFTYSAHGDLQTQTDANGTTTYDYDTQGALKQVDLPDGTTIEYHTDPQGRRIAKLKDGQRVQGFLYRDALNPEAELDGNDQVVGRFVYGEHGHVPAYLIKNGRTYRYITDHLGSVRLLVDTQDGTVAQRIDYDVWGGVLNDTNPGFQPFYFAGGLYDTDTGSVRFGARDYLPVIASWSSKDPLKFIDTLNQFEYSSSNPVNQYDPAGLYTGVVGAYRPEALFAHTVESLPDFSVSGCRILCVAEFFNPVPDIAFECGAKKVAGELGKAVMKKANKIQGAYDLGNCLQICNPAKP